MPLVFVFQHGTREDTYRCEDVVLSYTDREQVLFQAFSCAATASCPDGYSPDRVPGMVEELKDARLHCSLLRRGSEQDPALHHVRDVR